MQTQNWRCQYQKVETLKYQGTEDGKWDTEMRRLIGMVKK